MDELIDDFILAHNDFVVIKSKDLNKLPSIFNKADRLFSFPPNGNIARSEIEHYLDINYKNELVGFYKIIDLRFEHVIELHGSFSKPESFLVRSYFDLTKKFVAKVRLQWPGHSITSVIHKDNIKVKSFLSFLDFVETSFDENYVLYKFTP
jgi:hypothetical protein